MCLYRIRLLKHLPIKFSTIGPVGIVLDILAFANNNKQLYSLAVANQTPLIILKRNQDYEQNVIRRNIALCYLVL
jgi:hypothetical protein